MKLSNKLYDILKLLCTIVFPAIATLYAALGKIWGWPLVAEIVGTISAIDVFIGSIIGISSINYYAEQKLEEDKDDNEGE